MTRPTLLSANPRESFDEFGGGQVADPVPGVDGGVAEGEQQVRLAGSRGPDEAEVFGGPDPLQGPEVVEGGPGHRGHCEVVLGEGFW